MSRINLKHFVNPIRGGECSTPPYGKASLNHLKRTEDLKNHIFQMSKMSLTPKGADLITFGQEKKGQICLKSGLDASNFLNFVNLSQVYTIRVQ